MTVKVSNTRILVVDDDPPVLKYVEKVISRLGCRVIAATSGTKALAAAQGADGPIDLLLTDVVMPGMNGPQLAESFKEIFPDAHVIFMSGSGNADILLKGYTEQHGAIEYLPKPFTPKELISILEEVLAGKPRASPSQP